MNVLGIDYGTKQVGLAIAVAGIISPLTTLKNTDKLYDQIISIIAQEKIEKVFVGMSQGLVAKETEKFISHLSSMLQLPVESIEETVSTIEADGIYLENRRKKKTYKSRIDSIAAAVILRRAISY